MANTKTNVVPHSSEPTFNLKAVVQETGLKPDTLRAWERRYGLPNPHRTDGGHRLYSQKDINTLKWLIQRQQEGLSISRAVEMWRRLEAEGRNPLQVDINATPPPEKPDAAFSTVDAITSLRQSWIKACLEYDEQRAEHILAQTFALYPLEVACHEMLQKSLADIGEGWRKGMITVQQEHFASHLIIRWLEALVAATPTPTQSGRVIIGCPAGESHVLMSLMLTLVLRRRNRGVLYLGANIPTEQMIVTIRNSKTDMIVLSAQSLPAAAALFEASQVLQREEIPLAFGGGIFNRVANLRLRISGHYLGSDLTEAAETIETLLASPRPPKPHKLISKQYQDSLQHFQERQASLETSIWQTVLSDDPLHNQLPKVNSYLANHIKAALKLGDMKFLNTDLNWFLVNAPVDFPELNRYLVIYNQAAKLNLNERARPVLDWLDEAVK